MASGARPAQAKQPVWAAAPAPLPPQTTTTTEATPGGGPRAAACGSAAAPAVVCRVQDAGQQAAVAAQGEPTATASSAEALRDDQTHGEREKEGIAGTPHELMAGDVRRRLTMTKRFLQLRADMHAKAAQDTSPALAVDFLPTALPTRPATTTAVQEVEGAATTDVRLLRARRVQTCRRWGRSPTKGFGRRGDRVDMETAAVVVTVRSRSAASPPRRERGSAPPAPSPPPPPRQQPRPRRDVHWVAGKVAGQAAPSARPVKTPPPASPDSSQFRSTCWSVPRGYSQGACIRGC